MCSSSHSLSYSSPFLYNTFLLKLSFSSSAVLVLLLFHSIYFTIPFFFFPERFSLNYWSYSFSFCSYFLYNHIYFLTEAFFSAILPLSLVWVSLYLLWFHSLSLSITFAVVFFFSLPFNFHCDAATHTTWFRHFLIFLSSDDSFPFYLFFRISFFYNCLLFCLHSVSFTSPFFLHFTIQLLSFRIDFFNNYDLFFFFYCQYISQAILLIFLWYCLLCPFVHSFLFPQSHYLSTLYNVQFLWLPNPFLSSFFNYPSIYFSLNDCTSCSCSSSF